MDLRALISSLSQAQRAALAERLDQATAAHDADRGDGSPNRLVAYVVPAADDPPTAEALREYLRARLPEYMVPTGFVTLDDIPRTPNGKVDRTALRASAVRPTDTDPAEKPPRTATEEVVTSVWCLVLGISEINRTDHFFDLGGQSLLATRAVSRLRDTFGVELSLKDFLSNPTVAQLARHLDRCVSPRRTEAPTIEPVSRDQPLPLSYAQRRLWFLDRFEADRTIYNYSLRVDLTGQLDVPILDRCIDEIYQRHDVLRTIFQGDGDQPQQIVAAHTGSPLRTVDYRDLPEADADKQAAREIRRVVREPYDLSTGPLFRPTLVRITETRQSLILSMHHIVGDEWSMGVLFQELTALYRAHTDATAPSLQPLPIQYADFASWQNRWLTDDALEPLWEYWKKQLNGAPQVLELPADFPRPKLQAFQGERRSLRLPAALSDQIKCLARREQATLFMALLAAFDILIHRYTGRDDILIGSPVAGRERTEVESLIGFFVNTLVLRADLSGNPTFRDFLARVRETTLHAYANQAIPFERLVEHLQPKRDLSHSPLFQVMFSLKEAQRDTLDLPGITVEMQELDHGVAKFDLAVSVDDQQPHLDVCIEYNTALFREETIDRLLGHYHQLLASIVSDPDRPIDNLNLLTDDENRQLLQDAGQSDTGGIDPGEPFFRLFEEHARRSPDRVAVTFHDERVTYGQLNDAANQLAHKLTDRGIAAGSLVGVCVNRSPRMLVALLAVMKARCAYVPMDPAYPILRLEMMVEDSGLVAILTEEPLRERLPDSDVTLLFLDSIVDRLANRPTTAPPTAASASELAYVIFTSGSTGRPKGVAVPHRALTNFLMSMAKSPGFNRDDVMLAVTTLSFDIAGLELFLPLTVGGCVALVDRDTASDGRRLTEVIESHHATVMQATPATWRMMIDAGWRGGGRLRILCGGEAMPRDLVHPLIERSAELWNMYGPTETTIWSSVDRVQSSRPPITIGRPICNTQLYVLDGERNLQPIGVPGELYIGGEGLAEGYLDQPDLTAQRFVTDPFAAGPGSRLYRTGDLCRRLQDGRIEYLGRMDRQIKLRGFRIEPGEIIEALSRHPSIRQNTVTLRAELHDEPALVAYVVTADGQQPDTAELRTFLKNQLPEYMIPSVFVPMDSLPTTANGKVDHDALPAPGVAQPSDEKPYVAPRSNTEHKLTEIWSEVLKRKRIGIHDDYFELGGHSLQAVRVFTRIQEALGQDLPIATLFQYPTIAQLAIAIDDSGGVDIDSSRSLIPLQPRGDKPPFFFVHGLGGDVFFLVDLAKRLAPDQPIYGLQAAGRDGNAEPDTDVTSMAKRYLRAIRAVSPNGPYHLGGYSLGGLVAYEMARLLTESDEQVAILAILDTGPRPIERLTGLSRLKVIPHFLRAVPWWVLDDLLRTPPKRMANRLIGKMRGWWRRVRTRIARQPSPSTPQIDLQAVFGVRDLPDWRRRFMQVQYQAGLQYDPPPYTGRLTLFRARTPPLLMASPDHLGWQPIAQDGVRIERIPGNHDTILKEPYVGVLAARLRAITDKR